MFFQFELKHEMLQFLIKYQPTGEYLCSIYCVHLIFTHIWCLARVNFGLWTREYRLICDIHVLVPKRKTARPSKLTKKSKRIQSV